MSGTSKSYWRHKTLKTPLVKTKDGVYTPKAASFSNTVVAASGGQTSLITASAQNIGFAGNSLSATGDGVSDITTLFTGKPVDIPIGSNQVPVLSADIILTGGISSVEYLEWDQFQNYHIPGSHVMDLSGMCTSNTGMDAEYYTQGPEHTAGGHQINHPDGFSDKF
tara:strand:+ start:166 stop:663 length:498 start_codon:yes stop_codon:yes gene_type:complete